MRLKKGEFKRRLYAYACTESYMRAPDVAAEFGIALGDARNRLRMLYRQGKLRREGTRSTGYRYKLSAAGAEAAEFWARETKRGEH